MRRNLFTERWRPAVITNDIFVGSLNCKRKGFLKAAGGSGEPTDFEAVHLALDRLYRQQALAAFLGRYAAADVARDPPSLEEALRCRPEVIVNATAQADGLRAQIHLAERVDGAGGRNAAYAPVLFVRSEKVTRADKLLLAFQAVALAALQGPVPPVAKLVHGAAGKVLRVKVEALVGEVRKVVAEIQAIRAAGNPPRVTLNGHCAVCEFRAACRRVAEEADDLSLLRGLPTKEVEKQRARGVTTVTQFSHTYQPGRRGKRRSGKARKHDHALQALAVREKKVYVLDSPTARRAAAALYLDVEGVPDRDFDYLVGLVVVRDGAATPYSFWADDETQQRAMWDACARVIEASEDYTLYHYGRYELRFLDRMKRLASSAEEAARVDRIRAKSCNVLAAIHSHVYFPTYSNGLKDVGTFLGATWSAANASGVQSIAWRLAWEGNRDEAVKRQLLTYNQEDCLALRRVTEFLVAACAGAAGQPPGDGPEVASAQDIRPAGAFHFGPQQFFCPELAAINRCAYADYQRDKVYVRTCPAMRESLRRKRRASRRRLRVNAAVECSRPQVCPECGGSQIHLFGRRLACKVVSDLRITPSGVRRWLVRYRSFRYRCWSCQTTFLGDEYRAATARFGNDLSAWAVYQHVALRQSYEDVTLSLNEVFGFSFGSTILNRIKAPLAAQHRATYDRLKEKLRRGPLIHADETRAVIHGEAGYVWAFTNMEEVVYVYTPTREGTILDEMLAGFGGVLVSDFYSAYDAPPCSQQKCLIHLVRDINDDLFHRPFDEELKGLAQRLVAVLRPIIETIDRFGLKQYHLNKHKEAVAGYFRYLAGQPFASEAARKYQKRMQKYRNKLFVFLDHDGIPWNNNNAENAIKRFASRRRILGTASTRRGLQDYLVFLSIYQTCRHKGLSFLRFLRSGTFDIDSFAGGGGR
jgi:predicted RecB family nuclease